MVYTPVEPDRCAAGARVAHHHSLFLGTGRVFQPYFGVLLPVAYAYAGAGQGPWDKELLYTHHSFHRVRLGPGEGLVVAAVVVKTELVVDWYHQLAIRNVGLALAAKSLLPGVLLGRVVGKQAAVVHYLLERHLAGQFILRHGRYWN